MFSEVARISNVAKFLSHKAEIAISQTVSEVANASANQMSESSVGSNDVITCLAKEGVVTLYLAPNTFFVLRTP